MPELMNLLARLLETPAALLTADDLSRMDEGPRGDLLNLKILAPTRTATHVVCDNCYEGHIESVSRVAVPGRPPGLFIRCPEAGWVPVPPDRLRQWKIDVDRVASLLAAAVQPDNTPEVLVRGSLWRLGEIRVAGAVFSVVMAIAESEDLDNLLTKLPHSIRPMKTVLVVADFPSGASQSLAAVLRLDAAFRHDGAGFRVEGDRVRVALRDGIAERPNVFRSCGEYWELIFDQQTVHMKDSVGLAYIARLLSEPHRDIPAVSLLAARAGIDPLVASGSSGEVLDDEARQKYQRRYADLREDLLEANENNDLARTERLQTEMDQLASELARATGLSNRQRAQSDGDRVRKSVSMAVSREIEKIGAKHKPLGRHLVASITSGATFRYAPPDSIDWLT